MQANHESVLAERPLLTEQPEKKSMLDIEVSHHGESEAEGVKIIRPVIAGNGDFLLAIAGESNRTSNCHALLPHCAVSYSDISLDIQSFQCYTPAQSSHSLDPTETYK